MLNRCSQQPVLRDFIAQRNRLAIAYSNSAFPEVLASYLRITQETLKLNEDSEEFRILQDTIADLSTRHDAEVSDAIRNDLYCFIIEAHRAIHLTRHTILNKIIRKEILFLNKKCEELVALRPAHYSVINPANELGAIDECKNGERKLAYMEGCIDSESYGVYLSQIESASSSLISALQGGFPSDSARIYWQAIKPEPSEESRVKNHNHCYALEKLYVDRSLLIAELLQQNAEISKVSANGALAMILFANARINWMTSSQHCIHGVGRAVSSREFTALENLLDTISCLLLNETPADDTDRFSNVEQLLDDTIEKIRTL